MTVFAVSMLVMLRWAMLLVIACGALSFEFRDAKDPATIHVENPEPHAARDAARFEAVAITIDPHGRPLAAYQIELQTGSPNATLVGVEGGAHSAFAAPPYYDPHALTSGRIILAAFNTALDLPKEATRVATVMVHIASGAQPRYTVTLVVAADHDAHAIAATVTAQPLAHGAAVEPASVNLYPSAVEPRPAQGARP